MSITINDTDYSSWLTQSVDTSSSSSAIDIATDQFLTLFVAELQNQDPLEPTSNSEYIAQMAALSQVSQMEDLNAQIETLASSFKYYAGTSLSLQEAGALIGRAVAYTNSAGEAATGVIDSIYFDDGVPYYLVGNDVITSEDIVAIGGIASSTDETESEDTTESETSDTTDATETTEVE